MAEESSPYIVVKSNIFLDSGSIVTSNPLYGHQYLLKFICCNKDYFYQVESISDATKLDLEIEFADNRDWLIVGNSLDIQNTLTTYPTPLKTFKLAIANDVSRIHDSELYTYEHHLTVGQLRDFLNNCSIPDEGKVMIERVEDRYCLKEGWRVFIREGSYSSKDLHGKNIEETMVQYTPAWSTSCSENDKNLFIDLHY